MADFETLLYTLDSGVATITMNRQDVYNALNDAMKKELNEAFKVCEKDASVRCVVLRGSGEKAFCSGQDLKEHRGKNRSLKESLDESYNPLIRKMRSIEKPVIGQINGVAAGAGLSIALACDMRLMAEHAKLIEVFVRIALIPDSGSNWFLPRLVGLTRAFEYAALGDDITAEEALRVGLVNAVHTKEELETRTLELARRFATAPTKTIGFIKRTLNRSLSSNLDDLLDYEATIQEIASQTEDHAEGVKAFLEKRKAEFRGK